MPTISPRCGVASVAEATTQWPPLSLVPEMLRAAWQRTTRPLRVAWRRSWIYRRTLKGKMPDRIAFHPFDALPKRLEDADQLLRGRFRLAGDSLDIKEGSVFDAPSPSRRWANALHSFEWLPPLSQAGGEASRRLATNLISQWIKRHSKYAEPAWSADITATRLLHLFAHGRFVMANSDVLWRSKVLVSLREQSRFLARAVNEAPEGLPRLEAAAAHVVAGACLNDNAKRQETALWQLEEQIAQQILPDGGHVSRSPEALLHAYRYVIMVIDALRATDRAVPTSLQSAHDRMAPMLRFFRHGDGKLALFNGSAECDARMIEAMLARDEVRGQPFAHAPHSGFQRLAASRGIALMDCGMPPAGGYSLAAHAGCLSFEFSVGAQRMIVNCGTERGGSLAWGGALRATAAHSTVTLADTSMAFTLHNGLGGKLLGPRLLGGPSRVETSREERSDGQRVDARHDGYMHKFGIIHERSLHLTPRGNVLTGMDRLLPDPARRLRNTISYALRFHVHPDVRLSPNQGGGFLLKLPNGEGWRFRCDVPACIEESVYVGSGSVRRAEQIVAAGTVKDASVETGWSLEQMNTA
jgi:uncharacterized heparinase superfamily protein